MFKKIFLSKKKKIIFGKMEFIYLMYSHPKYMKSNNIVKVKKNNKNINRKITVSKTRPTELVLIFPYPSERQ